MNENRAIVIFQIPDRGFSCDLDIPLTITAQELMEALDEAYQLGMKSRQPRDQYLRSENPIALLRGPVLLEESGLHHGSILIVP